MILFNVFKKITGYVRRRDSRGTKAKAEDEFNLEFAMHWRNILTSFVCRSCFIIRLDIPITKTTISSLFSFVTGLGARVFEGKQKSSYVTFQAPG